MYRLTLTFLAAICCIAAPAQKTPFYNARTDMVYFVQGEDGTNGLSVAYNPAMQYYYCVFAGNSGYPLEMFDETGKTITGTEAGQDMRGFWYNPKTRSLGGTVFNSGGLFTIDLVDGGTPGLPNITSFTFPAPDGQAVAVLDPVKQDAYCYKEGNIYPISLKNQKKKKPIALKKCPVSFELLNPYSMIYTGYKNYEFGLLDYSGLKVYYFNKSGNYTHTTILPQDAPYAEVFRFAFCNDRIWLFDIYNRAWYSYLVFQ